MINYPNAQDYYNEALSIPLFYDLSLDEQKKVIFIIDKIIG
jgi:dTDP-4-amino-4,6-dideoxygalactose transaminase